MCLIALALDQHPRFPLVIAANRDEYLQRPSAALDWWLPSPDAQPVLGGRDLHAGGTWMGLNQRGRLALLTNVRDPARHRSLAPSRGALVADWLTTPLPAETYWQSIAGLGHNPFNLIAADLRGGRWWWADDRTVTPQALGAGLYGLSNAGLDSPWPKVRKLKQTLGDALASASTASALKTKLFAALADDSPVDDAELPDTGIGLERERLLAGAFIRTADGSYGTRCSTLLIVERDDQGLRATFVERQFDTAGCGVSQRRATLAPWPPQPGECAPVLAETLN